MRRTKGSPKKRPRVSHQEASEESLRFVGGRRFQPFVVSFPADDAWKGTPLFSHLSLATHELRQLAFILRMLSSMVDESLTDALVLTSTYRFFEQRGDTLILENVLSVPIDWWSVVDRRGHARYQVWIFAAGDAGYVFRGGTTESLGRFGQGTTFEPWGGPIAGVPGSEAAPEGLARELASAYRALRGPFERAIEIGGEDVFRRLMASQLVDARFE